MLRGSGFWSIDIFLEVIAGLLLIRTEGENFEARLGEAIILLKVAGELEIFTLFAFFPLNSCKDFFEKGFLSKRKIRI